MRVDDKLAPGMRLMAAGGACKPGALRSTLGSRIHPRELAFQAGMAGWLETTRRHHHRPFHRSWLARLR